MADKYVPSKANTSFGTYTNVAGVIGATAAGQVAALKAPLQALLGSYNPATGVVVAPAHPDFNKIDPATAAKINAEIDAVFAAIAAAPTA
jgi:hypothetical protein